MKTYERLTSALERVGAHLKRDRNHLVYELPNGKNFVVAKSPSDYRAEQNALSDLAAVAGVDVREKRTKAPADVRAERRARPGRAGAAPWAKPLPALADALRATGMVEQKLREALETARVAYDMLVDNERIVREKLIALEGRWYVRLGRQIDRATRWHK